MGERKKSKNGRSLDKNDRISEKSLLSKALLLFEEGKMKKKGYSVLLKMNKKIIKKSRYIATSREEAVEKAIKDMKIPKEHEKYLFVRRFDVKEGAI